MGIAGRAMQMRNPDGAGVDTSEGPFLRSDLPIAGFAVIEAYWAAAACGAHGHHVVRIGQ